MPCWLLPPKMWGEKNTAIGRSEKTDIAAAQGLTRLEAGMNIARHDAYRVMWGWAFRTHFQGVAMHRDNEPRYNQPGVYLIDDWR